jgi:hypothetical protein
MPARSSGEFHDFLIPVQSAGLKAVWASSSASSPMLELGKAGLIEIVQDDARWHRSTCAPSRRREPEVEAES